MAPPNKNAPAQWPTHLPTEAHTQGAHLSLRWNNDTEVNIPLVWLRDNCRCEECRIINIDEHRFFLGRHEELPTAQLVRLACDTLELTWSDGHRSVYHGSDIARLHKISIRDLPPVKLWHSTFQPGRYDAQTVLEDSNERLQMLRSYLIHGVVLLTGTDTTPGACGEIIQALGAPIRDTPFDRIHDVYFNPNGYNVAHTDEALLPHTDFPSYHWPPSGQVLHMLVNEVSGGESIVVDGWQVLERLRDVDPQAFDVLSTIPVSWREHSAEHETWSRAPLIRTDRNGQVLGLRFSNQLMQPLDPTLPALEDFYRAYHRLARMIIDPANQCSFRMNGGDLMLVHGHRVMHGRSAFSATTGQRHLQDTYFEFDDLAAQAARLGGEAST